MAHIRRRKKKKMLGKRAEEKKKMRNGLLEGLNNTNDNSNIAAKKNRAKLRL